MTDIIHLLPDNVANQIAAGEVIQRPASVVKELLENSIDAGATKIQLVIKDAGKTLIQVIDDGKGMSETDARMCFERHATSKIKNADELFDLHTKGFRGEALASIASIAHVQLKSKQTGNELGTSIEIEGSIVKSQEPVASGDGTTFSVKNLFYNVPARRNFLKSDQVETRHITEEFIRVAIPHTDIEFTLTHNGEEVYHLMPGSLRQRLAGIYGKKYDERIVPIDEKTTIVHLSGFIGKPEHARKTRGEQYFFVNNRYIKSPYLNHAISKAYDELISNDQFPSYFIFLEVDPASIDVNIHPTKTEVKFEEEKSIYAILQSSVRNSLGKFNIAPTIDFDQESTFNKHFDSKKEIKQPMIQVNPDYNPFKTGSVKTESTPQVKQDNWESLFEVTQESIELPDVAQSNYMCFQVAEKYIVTKIGDALVLIDQYRAHYRVLYENFKRNIEGVPGNSQTLIFPEIVPLNNADFKQLNAIEHELRQTGFEFTKGDRELSFSGKPTELEGCDTAAIVEQLLEVFNLDAEKDSPKEKLARTLASAGAVRKGRKMEQKELTALVESLLSCENSNYAPNGKRIMVTFDPIEIQKMFI